MKTNRVLSSHKVEIRKEEINRTEEHDKTREMASLAMETAMACTPMASKRKPPWRRLERGVALTREGTIGSARSRALQLPSPSRTPRAVLEGLGDLVGGDLLGFDLAQWEEDVETHGALAFYAPHEGGYEGRYASRLRCRGYHFLDLTARGLGDVEAYLSKIHGVRPPHLGKQKTVCWYYPPEIDYRLSLLPENSKGLVLWLIEARVLSKSELQYLALLPVLQPKVKVIAECGTWRKVRWKPLREIAGLDLPVNAT